MPIIKEVECKSVLSKSRIADYTVNCYTGCLHGCVYCYARYMKRFSGHTEPWGQFVDVKVNAPYVLEKELRRRPQGRVIMSSVCDGWQPLERIYFDKLNPRPGVWRNIKAFLGENYSYLIGSYGSILYNNAVRESYIQGLRKLVKTYADKYGRGDEVGM